MKTTHRISLLSVLLLVLTTRTFGGQIDTPGIASPPPPPPAAASTMVPSEISIGGNASALEGDSQESASLTDVTLSLLQIMLSVF